MGVHGEMVGRAGTEADLFDADGQGAWCGEFFAPSSTDMVDSLVAQYRQERNNVEHLGALMAGDMGGAAHYFIEGNAGDDRLHRSLYVDRLFRLEGAIGALNSAYWSKALALTDVYDAMPQARREQWNAQLKTPEGTKKRASSVVLERERWPERFSDDGSYVDPLGEWEIPPLPDFEADTVRSTLQGLLASRAQFLAERVDGIFRALSGDHVTNSPAAFGKRMIIARLIDGYGSADHNRVGYINDLRCVIARFMGRDEPSWYASSSVVKYARSERRGEWVTLDGGALRLRAYKCGTAHLEVHPDMAWRLNGVLAHLYPMAIPPEFRSKPKRQAKGVVMMNRPLPFAVVEALEGLETAVRLEANTGQDAWRNKYRHIEIPNALQFKGESKGAVREEAERVLACIGGVKVCGDRGEGYRHGEYFQFDYPPHEAVREIVASGCIPDRKSHQFYPTPRALAELAITLAAIGPEDQCLEPSAGTGAIADLLPPDRTLCVEISALHCTVLKAKGLDAVPMDFIEWSALERDRFDCVVCNPPYSEGRWRAHIEAAHSVLRRGGRLVAILPASARNKTFFNDGRTCWSEVFENRFAGTSISVAIMTFTRGAG